MFGAPNFFFSGAKKSYYRVIQQFNATGSWTAPTGVTSVDYLVVAGGASGGWRVGGGGGAGGLLQGTNLSVTPGTTYTITVGAGGAANTTPNNGYSGTNSTFGLSLIHI